MIEVEDKGAARRIILARTEKANSLTREMLMAAAEAAENAPTDTRVLIITGHGNVFSAGADLEEARAGLATDPVWERLSTAIAEFPGLAIAALNGTAAGGSLGMVLACDLRIAVPGAKIFYPVMRLGFLPQPSDPARMRALIGPARSAMILMAGARIAVEEALEWGLVDRIVPTEDLEQSIETLSADALAADASHVAAIKALIA